MSERRYSEEEVAAIFQKAAEAQHGAHRQLTGGEGMTLAQIQEIGREVGMSPDQVSEAAKSIDITGRPTVRKFMGLPIGVGLSVDLDRKLTDDEWERFVVDLRETFDAKGKVTSEGSFRQWTNGNLQALLEPTPTGQRIRLKTVKGDARGMINGGLAMLFFSATVGAAAIMRGGASDPGLIMALSTLATMGAGMFAVGGLQLPRWARLRRSQMEDLAARVAHNASAQIAPADRIDANGP